MKVMVFVKASKASEAGEMPSTELITEMMQFNEELSKAGVLLAGDGLQPSSKGVRVHFSGKDRVVTDGPFAETKELIAGYWLWQVASLQEAIDWVKRCPNPHAEDSVIEIRPVFEAEDFGEAMTPEVGEQWERLQAEAEARTKSEARRQVSQGLSPHLVIDGAAQAIDFY
ncbi:MAG: YciI family protein, partial [Dichotomicrobium sp.]